MAYTATISGGGGAVCVYVRERKVSRLVTRESREGGASPESREGHPAVPTSPSCLSPLLNTATHRELVQHTTFTATKHKHVNMPSSFEYQHQFTVTYHLPGYDLQHHLTTYIV